MTARAAAKHNLVFTCPPLSRSAGARGCVSAALGRWTTWAGQQHRWVTVVTRVQATFWRDGRCVGAASGHMLSAQARRDGGGAAWPRPGGTKSGYGLAAEQQRHANVDVRGGRAEF